MKENARLIFLLLIVATVISIWIFSKITDTTLLLSTLLIITNYWFGEISETLKNNHSHDRISETT